MRTLAFDSQPHGTPNRWLDYPGVTEEFDAVDGVPAWQKYVMDTDPNMAGDYLGITAVSNLTAGSEVLFTPSSTRRHHTLTRTEALSDGGCSNVPGQVSVPDTGGDRALQDTNQGRRVSCGCAQREPVKPPSLAPHSAA